MKKQHACSAIIIAVIWAALAGLSQPAAATAGADDSSSSGSGSGSKATSGRRESFRQVDAQRRRSPSSAAAAAGSVQAAADGDALTLADPAGDTTDSKADIREVLVGSGGGASLLFTMKVETYTNPGTDPAWVDGFTGAFWYVDTSGDNEPEVIVEIYNDGTQLAAGIFDPDAADGTFVCDAVPSTNATNKSYTVTVTQPGCLGDVKQPAVAGGFNYDLPSAPNQVSDFAPNNGNLVRFNRPVPGQPAGGYAIVSRPAGFARFGALPPGPTTPSGTYADYIGPGPVVGAASAREFHPGLWAVSDNGEVSTQDDAEWYGDVAGLPLAKPIVGMAVMADRLGYWLVASDGGIFTFGEAGFFGSTGAVNLNKPIVGMAATPSGQGYWLVASDGGIFTFGDAAFHGSTGAFQLNRPVVGMAAGYQGQGYWLVASDGGIFSFGLPFYGSTGGLPLQQPIVGMAATRSGGGYRFIARDGGLFTFGDAEFHGSAALPGRTDIVGLATA